MVRRYSPLLLSCQGEDVWSRDTRIIGDLAVAFRFVNDPCCAIVASMQCASLPGCRREVFLLVPGLLFGCLAVAPAAAQQAMTNMPDMEMVPAPEQLPVPVRMQGIGNSHITIKATPDAQAWFDQGLSLLHDFWEYESAKAFEQGIRWIRTAPCAGGDWRRRKAFEAERTHESTEERCPAEAVRFKNPCQCFRQILYRGRPGGSKGERRRPLCRIRPSIRNLVKKYPPRHLRPASFWPNRFRTDTTMPGSQKMGEKESLSILEGVLRDSPNDSAANHYWIHAIEPGNHPERAVKSAALLASLAPTSGHMVHMPGHIYYRLGDYSEAEAGSPLRPSPMRSTCRNSMSPLTMTGITCTT